MSKIFEEAFAHVIGVEGRYSNDPLDSGGETMYGITARVARAYGYQGEMRLMPLATAHYIYKDGWWDKLNLDAVAALTGSRVATEMFECGVNLPWGKAGTFLQEALNLLNQNDALWKDVPVDGDVGKLTLAALKSYIGRRGQEGVTVLLRMLNCQQGAHYMTLGKNRKKDERFMYGWFLNRIDIA